MITAAVLGCGNGKAPGEDTEPDQTSEPSASNPLDVSVSLDAARAASAPIGPEGGKLTATAADGSKITLTIPPDALAKSLTISMTPVRAVDGLPLSGGLLAAVQLAPEGLRMRKLVTLSIESTRSFSADELTGFAWLEDGKDFHLYPTNAAGSATAMKLMHFSGAGIGRGTAADRSAQSGRKPRSAEAAAEQELAKKRKDPTDDDYAASLFEVLIYLVNECVNSKEWRYLPELSVAVTGLGFMAMDGNAVAKALVKQAVPLAKKCLSFDVTMQSTIDVDFPAFGRVHVRSEIGTDVPLHLELAAKDENVIFLVVRGEGPLNYRAYSQEHELGPDACAPHRSAIVPPGGLTTKYKLDPTLVLPSGFRDGVDIEFPSISLYLNLHGDGADRTNVPPRELVGARERWVLSGDNCSFKTPDELGEAVEGEPGVSADWESEFSHLHSRELDAHAESYILENWVFANGVWTYQLNVPDPLHYFYHETLTLQIKHAPHP
jgi:hypothetical protein